MHREAAISRASAGAERIWAGTVTIEPARQTGPHHHGPLESVIYVRERPRPDALGRSARVRRRGGPGDFIYVPARAAPGDQRQRAQPLSCVVVRSDQEPVVVNLDIAAVQDPLLIK